MKNVRFMPNFPTETQAIPARTQSTQTLRRSGDERPAPELHKLYWYKPAAAIINPAASGEPRKRGSVERCRRERRRAPQSPSPISLTAPARREADASGQLTNRIPDKQTRKPEAAAPIPVHKQDHGTSPVKRSSDCRPMWLPSGVRLHAPAVVFRVGHVVGILCGFAVLGAGALTVRLRRGKKIGVALG